MKAYAVNCVNDAAKMMISEWRNIIMQLENIKDKEVHLK